MNQQQRFGGLEITGFFGEWLKRRRRTLDLTQEELAGRAGCSVFALRKIESGERRPSKQLACLLAEALAIEPENRQSFIRAARGELSVERLGKLSSGAAPSTDSGPVLTSHPLPLLPARLLGREAEIAAVERLFKNTECRLLTLTGMGGIGKTSLAIEYATGHQADFPGGLYYVPLAPVQSVDLIIPAIAEVLGFSFSGPAEPKQQLLSCLARGIRGNALFVFDNLEHLLAEPSPGAGTGAAGLVSELLQRLPNVKVLATSRERLNLQGEWTYELHGLPLPPDEYVERPADYSAAALFVQSARRTKAGFEIAADERSALVRICRMLEGIPLAIELAAAWVGILSCHEIAREIEANIDFLATSVRDIPERHRSLRATFDHSWGLLSEAERGVLCRLAVFHGGFDREAAGEIAGATLPLLASLVSKSLVWRTENGRYDLHEVIRQFAMSHLDQDEKRSFAARDRHCEYYLRSAANHERTLKSAAQQQAMHELTNEIDNIRAAWAWAIEHQKFVLLGASVRTLGWMFEVGGLLHDGIEQLELLIHALKAEPHADKWDRALGLTLSHQGLLYFRKGQFGRAHELYEESITILRSCGEQAWLADALIFLGVMLHLDGEYDRARSLVEEGLVLARAAHDQWFAAYAIFNLGYIDSLTGQHQKGYEQMKEGVSIWRTVGDPHSIALGLNHLVTTLIKLGRYEEAQASMQESISLCEQTKNRWGMGTAYRYLGLVDLAQGDVLRAQSNFRRSLEIFGDYFVGWDVARSTSYLGDAALLAGDLCGARQAYLDTLSLSVQVGAIPIALDALVGMARVQFSKGEIRLACELAQYVLGHPASVQEAKDQASQLILELDPVLDAGQVEAMRARASHKSIDALAGELLAGQGGEGSL